MVERASCWATFVSLAMLVSVLQSAGSAQDLAGLYDKVKEAIVVIQCTGAAGQAIRYGTGFFVSKDGIIITNYHVISGATSISVKDQRHHIWNSVLIGPCDEPRDLAALRVPFAPTPFLDLQKPPTYRVGQPVVAIGNPQGLESTLSSGIISGRRMVSEEFGEIIQTTAPIGPGSSGGPLLSFDGEVLGVTTFQLVNGQNLNFAIPVHPFIRKVARYQWSATSAWRKDLVGADIQKTLQLATTDEQQGRRESAKQRLAAVLQMDETNHEALIQLASIHVREWNYAAALELLRKFTAADSTSAEAYFLEGVALDKLGHPVLAIASYERALILNQNLPNAHFALAVLYRLQGNREESKKHLDQLQILDRALYERYVRSVDN